MREKVVWNGGKATWSLEEARLGGQQLNNPQPQLAHLHNQESRASILDCYKFWKNIHVTLCMYNVCYITVSNESKAIIFGEYL